MLSKWPIRSKLILGLALLLAIVALLSYGGLAGLYAYRGMVRVLGERISELPPASELGRRVSDARVAIRDLRTADHQMPMLGTTLAQEDFAAAIDKVRTALAKYRAQLGELDQARSNLEDGHLEWETVLRIETILAKLEQINQSRSWVLIQEEYNVLRDELDSLQHYTTELPTFLHHKIANLRTEVRDYYSGLMWLVAVTSILGVVMLGLLLHLFYLWIFRPLGVLIHGSRRVAGGDFEHRIELHSGDEMAELALAMNAMTIRFCDIRTDLDRQVAERTKQALRAEKLASVGFLAAGVAHEINNPLAAVSVCAEALESRLAESLETHPDRKVIQNYLEMIQRESFRCKGITEKLLDFSRMGERRREHADLRELVAEMIELLTHHGKYKDKRIVFEPQPPVLVSVNVQEMKQVVLNLLVNALDATEAGGSVRVGLSRDGGQARLDVQDDGCGMTPEVREHLFEPFFTRKKQGQGTGLGLSITHQIVTDHEGGIEADSDGPGKGSRFRVTLPLAKSFKEESHFRQAA